MTKGNRTCDQHVLPGDKDRDNGSYEWFHDIRGLNY